MKKNSIMVKQVLMSIITAGIFTFGFTSCSDDDPMSQDSAAANQEITSDGEGISKPIGLVYTDFITENDVQILNADTTEIAVSKALADKKGITNFVNHPMGIWQAFDQRQVYPDRCPFRPRRGARQSGCRAEHQHLRQSQRRCQHTRCSRNGRQVYRQPEQDPPRRSDH